MQPEQPYEREVSQHLVQRVAAEVPGHVLGEAARCVRLQGKMKQYNYLLLLLCFFHDATGLLANSYRKSFMTKVIVQYFIFLALCSARP